MTAASISQVSISFEWLIQAHSRGATAVVFDIRNMRSNKWPAPLALRRFWSICEPGPALIGLPRVVFGPETTEPTRAKDIAKPGGAPFVAFWRKHGRFKRLRSIKPAGSARYTVTLRKTQRSPGRDSDEAVWRDFASEIGALVIADYDDKQIHLHDRMALYAGAQMNFFVSNGPGVLCSFTEYPCMLFNTQHAKGSLQGDGIADGAQYPWLLQNQRAVWELATSQSLRRHFYHWLQSGKFAEDRYEPATQA